MKACPVEGWILLLDQTGMFRILLLGKMFLSYKSFFISRYVRKSVACMCFCSLFFFSCHLLLRIYSTLIVLLWELWQLLQGLRRALLFLLKCKCFPEVYFGSRSAEGTGGHILWLTTLQTDSVDLSSCDLTSTVKQEP